ncbi:kelch-like protein 5 isoform X2 [Eurosta solidaginis]|uniref:kelch-like protein 5 isoform X2 n=1 Tax=Eurosta solidaginis TaxID=178769 RepID=UPI003531209D
MVIQSNEFLNFDASKLQTILESDDLNIQTERVAFEAIKLWYEHDASARKQKLSDLISYLRWTQLDTNFIIENIRPLPGCHVVALEAVSWLNIPSIRKTISLRYTSPRKAEPVFLALNTWGGQSRAIFQYDKTDDLWHEWVDIKTDVTKVEVILMDDNLIFIGGTRNDKAIDEVSSWNFNTKIFQRLPSMNQSRYLHYVVELNRKIYAVGGKGANGEILQSVEMYTASDGWKAINSMSTPRAFVNAVVLNEKIYVIGGENSNKLKSVECYDPTTNSWTQCADVNEIHSNPGASVHNGQIFVVGGAHNIDSSTVERYDPQRNEWTKICSLNIKCQRPGCISIYNQLWAVGGYQNWCTSNFVSVYDEQNDKWIDKKPIPKDGYYYCFTAPKCLL